MMSRCLIQTCILLAAAIVSTGCKAALFQYAETSGGVTKRSIAKEDSRDSWPTTPAGYLRAECMNRALKLRETYKRDVKTYGLGIGAGIIVGGVSSIAGGTTAVLPEGSPAWIQPTLTITAFVGAGLGTMITAFTALYALSEETVAEDKKLLALLDLTANSLAAASDPPPAGLLEAARLACATPSANPDSFDLTGLIDKHNLDALLAADPPKPPIKPPPSVQPPPPVKPSGTQPAALPAALEVEES